jgi:hypothetical protein
MFAPSANYQVTKRPMNETERNSVDQVFRNAQKQARPIAVFALLFAIIGIFAGSATIDISTSKGMTTLVILVVGLGAFGFAFMTFRVRKNVEAAQKDGNVVVVKGMVSQFAGKVGTSATTVGPLTIGWNSKTNNPLQQGSFAEVGVSPKLRSVVSVNGVGLEHPIRIMVPNDLEAGATTNPPAYPMPAVNPSPAPEAMSFCPSCGTPASGLAFCSNCGNKF